MRVARGLYRYGPTGEIYLCLKVAGRNVWRNLSTTDRRHAMAKAASLKWEESQNGNHAVAVMPDNRGGDGGFLAPREAPPATPSPVPPTTTAAATPDAPPTPPGKTLGALMEEVTAQSRHLAKSTQKLRVTYQRVLAGHLDFGLAVRDITPGVIRKVRGALSEGHKASYVNDIISKTLGPALALAVESGLIDKSPLEAVKPLKKSKSIRLQPTWEQAHALIAEAEKTAPDSALLLRVMVEFGLGQAEIKGIRGEHFVFEGEGCLHVLRQKTRKPYEIPLFRHTKDWVSRLREAGMMATGKPVFNWQNPRKALESACKKLGLPMYSPRALRRTFIIHCLEQGLDARVVARWQGHADAKLILGTYGDYISPEHARRQAEKLQ